MKKIETFESFTNKASLNEGKHNFIHFSEIINAASVHSEENVHTVEFREKLDAASLRTQLGSY